MSTATEVDGYCPLILNGVMKLWKYVYEEREPIQSMMNIQTHAVFIMKIALRKCASHITTVQQYKKINNKCKILMNMQGVLTCSSY